MPLKDHPAVAAALLSAALIAARLLAVARFDVSTAATILSVSGTSTAVAGTMLTLLPFVLVLVTGFLAVVVFVDDTLLPTSPSWDQLLLVLAVGATLALTAVPLALVTLAWVAAMAALRWANRGRRRARVADVVAASRALRVEGTVLLVLLALTPIVLQRPWLPVQAVRLDDGAVLVGYVLGDAQGRLALMSDRDRTIRFLAEDDISERFICSAPARPGGLASSAPQLQLGGSLLGALLWGADVPSYPPCPRPRQASSTAR